MIYFPIITVASINLHKKRNPNNSQLIILVFWHTERYIALTGTLNLDTKYSWESNYHALQLGEWAEHYSTCLLDARIPNRASVNCLLSHTVRSQRCFLFYLLILVLLIELISSQPNQFPFLPLLPVPPPIHSLSPSFQKRAGLPCVSVSGKSSWSKTRHLSPM